MVKNFTNRRSLNTGFTLLELLMVLAIAGLLVSLVPSMISAAIPGTKLKVASRDIAITLRDSRNKAVSLGKIVDVIIRFDPPRYFVDDNSPEKFPDGVDIVVRDNTNINSDSALSAIHSFPDDQFRIRFYPDGSSSGAIIKLRHERLAYFIAVEWLLGRVSLSRPPDDAS